MICSFAFSMHSKTFVGFLQYLFVQVAQGFACDGDGRVSRERSGDWRVERDFASRKHYEIMGRQIMGISCKGSKERHIFYFI